MKLHSKSFRAYFPSTSVAIFTLRSLLHQLLNMVGHRLQLDDAPMEGITIGDVTCDVIPI